MYCVFYCLVYSIYLLSDSIRRMDIVFMMLHDCTMRRVEFTAMHKKAVSPLLLDLPLNIIYNTCLLK